MLLRLITNTPPSALVVGVISGVDEEWLAAMPWDKFDALALHLYVPPAFLRDQGYSYYGQGLPNMKQVLARYPSKPIWITEFGYSSGHGAEPWFVVDEGARHRRS